MKNSPIEQLWDEYLNIVSKFIPLSLQKKILNKKFLYITLLAVVAESIILYWIFIR